MWALFFAGSAVRNFTDASASDTAAFGRWFRAMLARGIYLAPSQFEANFIGDAHAEADIEATIAAAAASLETAFA